MRTDDRDAAHTFAGAAMPVEPGGALALPDDPHARDHLAGSPERVAMDAINHTYTSLLAQRDDPVNDHANAARF
ncbi:MAG: hypothetical protein ACP5PB_10545 [Acidimicrobiales bacterium]